MHDLYISVLLFFAGAAASFINMMAGGGSLITLGLMMILCIDPSVANGTNRIGVVVGTGSGAWAFKSEKLSNLKESLILGGIAIPGAIIGSLFSIQMSNVLFQQVIAGVMIFVLLTILWPKRKRNAERKRTEKSIWIYPSMFLVGLYGGFIQVGVGFILMAAIKNLLHLDLLKTNMHKVFIVFIYTLPILLIFGINGKINWLYAVVMSMGNALGSWVSVKIAVKKGERFVKLILAVAVLLMVFKILVPQI